jgi:hypothetical protein
MSDQIWLSLPDADAIASLKTRLATNLKSFCQIIARSEKVVYDKRAKTLIESHPLAIQVNLDTGVANGVLVVRSIAECAELLRRVLLYDMKFDLVVPCEKDGGVWCLSERISRCIFRVVTNDNKLSNCFWNFYLR